jgi:hypothetical protein
LRDELTTVVGRIGAAFVELSKIWKDVESKVQWYIDHAIDLETRRVAIATLSSFYACNYVLLVSFVNACLNQRDLSHYQISIQVSDKRSGNILHPHLARGKISEVLILVCFLIW